jgi:hypothetical protein
MKAWQTLKRPPWRTVAVVCVLLLISWFGYLLWQPGLDVRDGRHDLGRNGIWVGHGWLGGDEWFVRNGKTNELGSFRDGKKVKELADNLRQKHVRDIFPHLCPCDTDGNLPAVDAAQVERFLDAFDGFRVIPWIGGPNSSAAQINSAKWRQSFAANAELLLADHPRFAGIQVNIEPLQSGDTNFLILLEELREKMPAGKILSVAAYPPPTRWHPFEEVHWEQGYFREVARRSDQLAVMMYDAAQRVPKLYERLMADWSEEVLVWSEGKDVLLGVPTYDDASTGYHDPKVENLTNALRGIHSGLSRRAVPTNYQGVSIYCEWETSQGEWLWFDQHFLRH